VFDLLGDLYTLPLAGGEAKPLTHGLAWDMPRSPPSHPTASAFAYVSDQGGGDNLWIANADGSDANPLTTESYELLDDPGLGPDWRLRDCAQHAPGGERAPLSSRRNPAVPHRWRQGCAAQ